MRRTSRRSASPDRIAAVTSDWIRSRRDTGMATSGGGGSSPGQRSTAPNALGARIERALPARSPEIGSADRGSGVLLALRFLALALHARLLVVLASASLGEDAGLLDLLVEAAQGAFERLVLTHSDLCQSRFTSPGQISRIGVRLAANRPARTP